MSDKFLTGRTALVSGGGSGLGKAIGIALAERGARVILTGRNRDNLVEAQKLCSGSLIETVDVADPESVRNLGQQLRDEEISILINNAGIAGPVKDLVDVSPDEWNEVFAVNVQGTYLMCKEFLPQMVERKRGDVINIASVSGKRPLPGRTPYTASKMAVIGLTATLAYEVGQQGVMVNSLSPGPVDSARMHRNFTLEAERRGISYESAHDEFVARSAMRRMITEQEVATAAVMMLQMPGLCGADIDLSAGMIARS